MALESFEYTKTWESADDFPTIETDETKVREDIQCLYDEIAAGLNALITALNAGGIDTAQLKDGSVTTDKLHDGAVTLAKLAADVKTVFWAVYGTTTKDELDAAYAAGKEILCVYDRCVYRMSQKNATGLYYFEMADPTQMRHRQLTFNSSNLAWNNSNYTFLPKNNAAMTGTPTAPTAAAGTNSTQVATTAFVKTALDNAKEVFWATYGTTTYNEINQAYAAGKLIVCVKGDLVYMLGEKEDISHDPEEDAYSFNFFRVNIGGVICWAYCTSAGVWDFGAFTTDYDDLSNRPGINGQLLTGNKRGSQLNLIDAPQNPSDDDLLYYDSNSSVWQADSPEDLGLINVFIAEYGVTPVADIEAAYQAGKIIVCNNSDGTEIGYLVDRESSTDYLFASPRANHFIAFYECDSDGWTSGTIDVPVPQAVGTPANLGTAARGTATTYSRSDHVHETQFFIATVGVTTKAEIDAEVAKGKIILANKPYGVGNLPQYYQCTKMSSTDYTFSRTINNDIFTAEVDSEGWTEHSAYVLPVSSPPGVNGTYVLTCTVNNGAKSYSWEAQT